MEAERSKLYLKAGEIVGIEAKRISQNEA